MERRETSESAEHPALRAFRQTHPPFITEFSPTDELDRLKVLPRDEKKEALAAFKEQYLTQQEAWAACRVAIEKTLEKSPDTDREVLMETVHAFGLRYGFTQEQIEEAEGNIDAYRAVRARVLELRERVPNNHELVEELTGMEFDPGTKFLISTGPMSIDIVTDGVTAHRIHSRDASISDKPSFAAFAATGVNGVNYSVYVDGVGTSRATFVHELEHQKNKIFQDLFEREMEWEENGELYDQFCNETDPEVRRTLAESILMNVQQHILDRAKDEILAVASDREWELKKFASNFKPDGSYDYMRKSWMRPETEPEKDDLWKEIYQQIIVDDYLRFVDRAIDAYGALEKFYDRKEIAALLADKPMEDWPKFATRVYQDRLEDPTLVAGEVLALQKKRETRERLTRRAFLVGSAGVAGGLAALKIEDIPEEQTRIHNNLENVASLETEQASYRIAFTNRLSSVQPEIVRDADAVVLEVPQGWSPAAWVEEQLMGWSTRTANGAAERALAQGQGLDPDYLRTPYQELLTAALDSGIPVYLVDKGTSLEDSYEEDFAKEAASIAAAAGGIAMIGLGADNLQQNTRRGFLRQFGKMALGLPLLAPFVGRRLKELPLEPKTNSVETSAVAVIQQANDTVAPFLQNRTVRVTDTLMAQNGESIARRLTQELGRKARLALVVGNENLGVEAQLRATADERLRILNNELGEVKDQGAVSRITREDGYLRREIVIDSAYEG